MTATPLTYITTQVPTFKLVGIPPGDPCVAGAKYVITGERPHRWSPELTALHSFVQATLARHRPPHFVGRGSIAPAMKAWAG